MNKMLIWNNTPDFDDWKDDLESEYPDCSERELIDLMYDTNNSYLEDERMNLNVDLPQNILVIADLGLWDGRRQGYKQLGNNLSQCFSVCQHDFQEYFVDESGDLCATDVHHDGTNHYTFRMYRKGVTEKQIETLKDKIYAGTAEWADIVKVTRRLGDYAAKVYEWKLPGGIHI